MAIVLKNCFETRLKKGRKKFSIKDVLKTDTIGTAKEL